MATKLFRAASIAPAPAPKGNAKRINHHIEREKEKPKSESEVRSVLKTVTLSVPKALIRRAEKRLAKTVPKEMSMVI